MDKGKSNLTGETYSDRLSEKGNFIYEREELIISGPLPISFRINYSSMEEWPGGCMGEGWRHNFETRLRIEKTGGLTVCRADGKELPCQKMPGGLYASVLEDRRGKLIKEKHGYRYCDESGMSYVFDQEGKAMHTNDRNGNTVTFSHDQYGRLTSAKSANGELTYGYNRSGYLATITDHAGRKVTLCYNYGKLWKLIDPLCHICTYSYNWNGKLESVTALHTTTDPLTGAIP